MTGTTNDKPSGRPPASDTVPPADVSPAREAPPPPRWLIFVDAVSVNAVAMLAPFLLFRYVLVQAFQTFNLRVSSDEIWWNLPAVVRQDVLFAVGLGMVLSVADLLARSRRRSMRVPFKVVALATPSLIAALVTGMYAVYLDLGFFPSPASIAHHLSPDSPLLKTARTFLTAENAALVAVPILFPLAVKLACTRYRRISRGLGIAVVVLLAAGVFWPTSETLARAGAHPFGQIYDSLVRTDPDWDLERWSKRPVSFRSISGTVSEVSFEALSGSFADHDVVMVISESTGRGYLCDERAEWRYPNLRRLAAGGMDFTRYYTAGVSSIPSLFGLFTARPPLPLRSSRWYYPTDRRVLLPLELERRGYRTGFFHAGSFSAWFDHKLFESMKWDVFEDAGAICYRYGVDPESSSRLGEIVDERLVARRVLEWVQENRASRQRFFAAYFTSIPHLPYDFRNRTEFARHTGAELTRLESYENELGYVDGVLGELYDQLGESGFFENGLLVYTGDHGEAFGQHPAVISHSTHVFEEAAHVPMLMVNPGRFDRRVNPNAGSHVDFAATLADLLGLDLPQYAGGRSLLRPSDRQMVLTASVENHLKVGVIDGDYKYIYYRRGDRGELYNLREDPGETRDLSTAHPEWMTRYRELVHAYVARELGASRDGTALALEMHVQLGNRKLGYGDLQGAYDHFAEALEIDEDSVPALIGMAEVLTAQGRPEEAVETAARALPSGPDDADAHLAMAQALVAAGRGAEAVGHSRRTLEINPRHAGAHTVLGLALAAAGEFDQAIAELERALTDNPADADAHEQLGRLLIQRGDQEGGVEHLRACVRIDPERAGALSEFELD
ncbi:MAG TPA: sulfatase-like hydrolase/transferase [Phycisphaerae bacterium]|nr:sulfatase-like hydrolase/transferase [Phycisphaerae bacterium]